MHCGNLLATTDCAVLELTSGNFTQVVSARQDTCTLAARYARRFVEQLNRQDTTISDLFAFDHQDEFVLEDDANHDEHLVFLSHYKAEAGTEATLMQEALRNMIEKDVKSPAAGLLAPVFLDSEDLTDLSTLKDHVVKTHNVLYLLTPGILLRPWCLVEIVTAQRNDVQIVPVDIQRPGSQFKYPTEQFYIDLRCGSSLTEAEVKLLQSEGIELQDLEEAIRLVFTRIALPFSPHKSKAIREAELSDILNRCDFRPDKSKAIKAAARESTLSEPQG